jgi:hypothetical protein
MNAEQLAKYVKSGAVLLSVFGVAIEPAQIEIIAAAAGIVYGVVSALEAKYFKKSK